MKSDCDGNLPELWCCPTSIRQPSRTWTFRRQDNEKVEPRPVTQDFGLAIMTGALGISEERSKGLLDLPTAANDVIPGELRAMMKSRKSLYQSLAKEVEIEDRWKTAEAEVALSERQVFQSCLPRNLDGLSIYRPAPSFYEYYFSRRNLEIFKVYGKGSSERGSSGSDSTDPSSQGSSKKSSPSEDMETDISAGCSPGSDNVPLNASPSEDLKTDSSASCSQGSDNGPLNASPTEDMKAEMSSSCKWVTRYSPEPLTSTQHDVPFNKSDPSICFKNPNEMTLEELTEFIDLDLETYASMEDLEEFL